MRLVQGEERSIALPRSVILVPPGASHRISAGRGADIEQAAFCRSAIDPELLGSAADGLFGVPGSARGVAAPEPSIKVTRLSPAAYDETRGLLARLGAEGGRWRPGRNLMQRLMLAELLMVVDRCFQEGKETRNVGRARFSIEEVEDFVRERYAEEIPLPALAARFGFNPSYFSRLFSARAGVHIVEYINRVRIQKSCILLKRTSLSVAEIAFSVGYNNRSHFNRYFRRIMAMSPREYRNRIRR